MKHGQAKTCHFCQGTATGLSAYIPAPNSQACPSRGSYF